MYIYFLDFAILFSHIAIQDRGSVYRDFGFDTAFFKLYTSGQSDVNDADKILS